MRKIFHQGLVDKGLFKFFGMGSSSKDVSKNHRDLLASTSLWHDRLGHIYYFVLNTLLNTFGIKTIKLTKVIHVRIVL